MNETKERQPDEVLKEKAREFWANWISTPEGEHLYSNESMWDLRLIFAAAFAQSIQADARQLPGLDDMPKWSRKDLEKYHRWATESLKAFRDKFGVESNCQALDAIDAMKLQLAEARAQGMREAARILRAIPTHEPTCCGRYGCACLLVQDKGAAAIERAAEAQKGQLFAEGAYSQALIDRRNKPVEPKP